MGNEEVVFESSNPRFGVRTDGSIFATGEGDTLAEPVQFKVTASGPHTHVWKTVIQLAPIDPPSPQRHENEVSGALPASVFNSHHFLPFSSSDGDTNKNQVKPPLGSWRERD